ncbi:MAG: hypothetical protein H6Q72_299 [Firmicutes bacterium]|nr:hypothetical protein [Bacillota bacterium]
MNNTIENHAGYLIQQLSHLLEQRYNKNLANEDLSISHARVLYLLTKNNGMTQSELQQDLLIKASSVTKLIDILVQKCLVSRETSSEDARIKRIYLTEAGRQKENRLDQIREATEANLLQTLSETDCNSLIQMLKALKKNLV